MDCGAPAELENGLVTFSTRNNLTTYKSEIRYSCQQPYYQMLHGITGEPSTLNQRTPSSHALGLRVRLGAETASLLATVWEELGRETLGDMPHLSLPQACTPS